MKKLIGYALLTLLLSQTCFAQDWSAVASLRRGAGLSVVTKDGKKLNASFVSFEPDKLSVLASRKRIEISRDSVQSLYHVKGKVGRSALWGAVIGGGSLATMGAIACAHGCLMGTRSQSASAALGFGLFGAGVGAGVGALVGVVRHQEKLVYQAR